MLFEIPANATDEELQDIHCVLLDALDEIRVVHRWGPSTLYAVECTIATAAYVLGQTIEAGTRYRLTAGVDYEDPVPETVYGIDIFDANAWHPLIDDDISDDDVVAIAKRAGEYLGEHHPTINMLLRIDHMLIGRYLSRS